MQCHGYRFVIACVRFATLRFARALIQDNLAQSRKVRRGRTMDADSQAQACSFGVGMLKA
jgi:hypothetical protein